MVWKLKKTSYRFTLVVLASSKNNSSNELGHTVKSNKNGRLFPTTMNNATGKPLDGSTLQHRGLAKAQCRQSTLHVSKPCNFTNTQT
ncbi:hypothetical protein OUZ56_026834 [Daphnia magna]|uniref:Secreted protein n=1 Tax=Daphnia magna TaxID=35525 RepID=A0ABQ9ZMY8_9CRUS|nr:hypothetical protein OUZ56_026834 [Daphnia magna]